MSVEESERRVVLALGSVNGAPAPSFFPSLPVSARALFYGFEVTDLLWVCPSRFE